MRLGFNSQDNQFRRGECPEGELVGYFLVRTVFRTIALRLDRMVPFVPVNLMQKENEATEQQLYGVVRGRTLI